MPGPRTPRFEVAADTHGRDAGGLGYSGRHLNIDVSAVAAGAFLPGDRDEIQEQLWMIRVAADID